MIITNIGADRVAVERVLRAAAERVIRAAVERVIRVAVERVLRAAMGEGRAVLGGMTEGITRQGDTKTPAHIILLQSTTSSDGVGWISLTLIPCIISPLDSSSNLL